ncbi:uncharacterized protein EDB91DRAFT_1085348 [Suillus paluster]|uniref:uncharacterized protein n=1 Tax=Suillus paluster TaxID=48578 RepID=UPI001B872FA2|nr:uncharacterized protein EDB91DRAFT_1085348 [Suillus paluster]KAG1730673.1 hypothetical protein EDB91DRAFT_1085348 [Suillus paluster]
MNDTQIPQSPQSVRRNKSAAQRRYRKKEEEAFLLLREALKEVVKDDPRTRQDILTTASCELRRLADEKDLLLEQKARIEAWSTSKEIYKDEHSQSPSGRVIYEDPMQWWSHDRTKMADITRSDMARYRVLDAAMPSGNVTMPTVQGPQCTKAGMSLDGRTVVIPPGVTSHYSACHCTPQWESPLGVSMLNQKYEYEKAPLPQTKYTTSNQYNLPIATAYEDANFYCDPIVSIQSVPGAPFSLALIRRYAVRVITHILDLMGMTEHKVQ